MIIKETSIEDIEKIAELYVANWKETYRGMLPDEHLDNLDVSYGAEKWSEFFKQTGNHVFAAYDESELLGFGACSPDGEIGNCLYMDSLHVCPNARGRGVGTALIKAIREYAANINFDKMSVCVVRGNEQARELYCKLGAVHYSYFIDDFEGTKSNSEKLIWRFT